MNSENRITCIHHDDLDGRASAAIIVNKLDVPVLCIEMNYNRVIPIDLIHDNEHVFIVDFTPNTKQEFEMLLEKTRNVTWIDHHGKNIAKYPQYEALSGSRVDAQPSGAMLTWQFVSDDNPPMAIEHVSDYDCWIYKYGNLTKNFEAGMSAIDFTPHSFIWQELLGDNATIQNDILDRIIREGRVINRYRNIHNAETIQKCSFECELNGYSVIACNAVMCNSLLFDSVDQSKYQILAAFYSTGNHICVSLYTTRDDVNCADIASELGGGGHKQAAGFTCDNLPFTSIKELS